MPTIDYRFPCKFTPGEPVAETGAVPFEILARTSEPVDFFGFQLVHDFGGMKHKDKIGIDMQHDPDRLVGYADSFEMRDGSLYLGGAFTPTETSPYIADMLTKLAAGVPYEASIQTDYRDFSIYENGNVAANGREYAATPEHPVVLFGEWELRACAVCARGADGGTETHTLSLSPEEATKFKEVLDNRMKQLSKQAQECQSETGTETETDAETGTETDMAAEFQAMAERFDKLAQEIADIKKTLAEKSRAPGGQATAPNEQTQKRTFTVAWK